MRIEGKVQVETLHPQTRGKLTQWSSTAFVVNEADDPKEAWVSISSKSKNKVSFGLKDAQVRLFTKMASTTGMMTVTIESPRPLNIYISGAKPNVALEMAAYLGQYVPNASQEARNMALTALKEQHRRSLEEASKRMDAAYNASALRRPLSEISWMSNTNNSNIQHSTAQSQSLRAGAGSKSNTIVPTNSSSEKNTTVHQNLPDLASLIQDNPAFKSLSQDQRAVLDLVCAGENVFFTGSAGTGKSYLLQLILDILPKGSMTGATSLTGVTAVNLGGSTLSHWAGIGVDDGISHISPTTTDKVEKQKISDWHNSAVEKILKSSETTFRWQSTRTLIVDEVSMLTHSLFTALESVARRIRKNERPFGGLQLIMCGDFLQLPPVVINTPGTSKSTESYFAFSSPTWRRCFEPQNCIVLDRVFRQNDDAFISLLHKIREGKCDDHCMDLLQPSLLRGKELEPALKNMQKALNTNFHVPAGMIRAESTTLSVSLNQTETISTETESAANTPGDATVWLMCRRGDVDALNAQKLAEIKNSPSTFMAVDNVPSLGMPANKNTSLHHLGQLDRVCPAPRELTLKVGAQVMLVRNVSVNEGLCNGSSGVVVQFNSEGLPVVYFPTIRRKVVITSSRWAIKLGGKEVAAREQLPLQLAWAVSIHKSQGMTLDQAVIDLRKVFEHGQAYVALSRLRSLEGLTLVGFKRESVLAHPAAIEFYSKLQKPGISSSFATGLLGNIRERPSSLEYDNQSQSERLNQPPLKASRVA